MAGKSLTAKQRLFAHEYLVDKNATQAATRAGYSPDTAYSIGQRLLKNPEIAALVTDGLKKLEQAALKRAERRGITKERWLRELELIAFSDMDDFVTIDADGKLELVPSQDRKRGHSRVIKRISQSASSSSGEKGDSDSLSQALELHDKVKALGLVGDAFGWLKKTHELTGKDGQPLDFTSLMVKALEGKGPGDGKPG